MKYAFIREHLHEFRVCAMCRVLGVHRSGFYAWLQGASGAIGRNDAQRARPADQAGLAEKRHLGMTTARCG